jgi:amino acid transporter
MKKGTMIIIGIVLIIAAVVAVVASQQMYDHAAQVWMFTSAPRGNEMRTQADIVKYGGIGGGVIGGILLLVGLLKKS